MQFSVITNQEEYNEARKQVCELLEKGINNLTFNEKLYTQQVTSMLQSYEDIVDPDHIKLNAIDYIEFMMEQQNKTESDMKQYFGSATKTSEVLSGKRPLTMKMINKLHEGMHIPKELLIN